MESDHWSATLKFRGMLSNLAVKLTLEEGKSLAFIYEENIDIDKCIEVMDRITKRRRIVRGHREDLEHLKMSLDNVGRSDLKTVVDEYIKLHHCQQPLLEPVTTTHHGAHVHMVTESDMSRSKLSGLGVSDPDTRAGNKRRRVATEDELAEKPNDVCDSTSDYSDEAESCDSEEKIEKDRLFMKMAQEWARKSEDKKTKVGAVLVDSYGIVIGCGYNKMPAGCEDRFRLNWDAKKGKHHYVVYGIQVAINDAYKKKADLEGSILYTTLYPSNRCAQAIREAGIAEVVYASDKFRKFDFMKASKEIMSGIKCRVLRGSNQTV